MRKLYESQISVSISKVLLEHSQALWLHIDYICFPAEASELSTCDWAKAETLYPVVLYKKGPFLTPDWEQDIQRQSQWRNSVNLSISQTAWGEH